MTPRYLEHTWYLKNCDGNRKIFHLSVNQLKKITSTTVKVFKDSGLYLGERCQEYPGSMKTWERHIENFMQSKEFRTLHDLTGHPVPFHWRFYLGHTTTKIPQMMLGISRMVG